MLETLSITELTQMKITIEFSMGKVYVREILPRWTFTLILESVQSSVTACWYLTRVLSCDRFGGLWRSIEYFARGPVFQKYTRLSSGTASRPESFVPAYVVSALKILYKLQYQNKTRI